MVNLQMIRYGMCVAEFRNLAYEADNLQHSFNKLNNMGDTD